MTSDVFDVRAHLLDRQIVDADGRPVGVVDDVVFEHADAARGPLVSGLLTGRAVVDRIFGDAPEPARLTEVNADIIVDIGVVVSLSVSGDDLGDVNWVEKWMRDHVIARIPGNRRRG